MAICTCCDWQWSPNVSFSLGTTRLSSKGWYKMYTWHSFLKLYDVWFLFLHCGLSVTPKDINSCKQNRLRSVICHFKKYHTISGSSMCQFQFIDVSMSRIIELIMRRHEFTIRHTSEAFAVFTIDSILYHRLISSLGNCTENMIESCCSFNEKFVLKARIVRGLKHRKDRQCVPKTFPLIFT
jgi:hypothetical protein